MFMDIFGADFTKLFIMNLLITILGYCTVPIILRLKNGKYEYKKGHKIILINCAIVWFIFIIIKSTQGITSSGGAVFLYYFVNKAILLKPKEDDKETKVKENKKENYSLSFENEKVEKDPRLTYGEDVRLEKTVEPIKTVEKVVEIKEDKTFLYVIIGILAVAVIGIGIYALDLNNKMVELEEEYSSNLAEQIINSVKADFLDENIVFVIDGYGDYYYTYDQMNTVTQGIDEYSYWAYNKEQAIVKGYRAWK